MVNGTGAKTKEEVEALLRELEAEKLKQSTTPKKGCDWCGVPTSNPCKTVAEYAKCRNK